MKVRLLRPKWLRVLDMSVAVVTAALVGVGLDYNMRSKAEPLICKTAGENHVIELKDDKFPSERLIVQQCDTITLVNLDQAFYKIAFGIHDAHIDYPGYTPLVISYNDSIKLDAVQAGTFLLHDHLRDHAKTELVIRALASD